MVTEARAIGCLVGLALGDAYGAPFEGGFVERLVWRLLGRTKTGLRRWTDDTAMSLAVAESLTHVGGVDQDDLARRFAAGYRWSRGYGPGAARVLVAIRKGRPWREAAQMAYPGGSYGNGAAMRAPAVAIAYSGSALLAATADVAVVTHGHPLAIQGAQLVATAVEHALAGDEPRDILSKVTLAAETGLLTVRSDARPIEPASAIFADKLSASANFLRQPQPPSAAEVRARLGNAVTAADSCVTAIYLGLEATTGTFEALLARAADVGGDVDTIGAMAGAIWGARNGESALPSTLRRCLESEPEIVRVASTLYRRFRATA